MRPRVSTKDRLLKISYSQPIPTAHGFFIKYGIVNNRGETEVDDWFVYGPITDKAIMEARDEIKAALTELMDLINP